MNADALRKLQKKLAEGGQDDKQSRQRRPRRDPDVLNLDDSGRESLELREEASGERPGKQHGTEDADLQWVMLKVGILQGLVELSCEQWNQKMAQMDSETLKVLEEVLEEVSEEATRRTRPSKVGAVYRYASIRYALNVAIEEGCHARRISDYWHIENIRAAARKRPSNRTLGRIFGVDESTVRRWDEKAEKLNFSLHDADVLQKLEQIVNKRAPP